jgi:phosphoglycerate dehydrogenase-like enzyme
MGDSVARILITSGWLNDQPDARFLEVLHNAGHTPVLAGTPGHTFTESELRTHLPGISGVMAAREHYPASVITDFQELRVIARLGVGYDAIDLEAAADRGVPVLIAAGGNDTTVAETVLGLMLTFARGLHTFFEQTARGDWSAPPTGELREKTIGIVGLGRTGRAVVQRLRGFDVSVIASESYPDPEFMAAAGIELVEVDDLFGRADYISLHAPLTDGTRNLVDARRLGLVKRGAYLLNTARGGLVNEDALYDALVEGRLAGAALDAFTAEPPKDSRLVQLPNVLPTPHIGGWSRESIVRVASISAQNVVDVLDGEWDRSMVVNGVFPA